MEYFCNEKYQYHLGEDNLELLDGILRESQGRGIVVIDKNVLRLYQGLIDRAFAVGTIGRYVLEGGGKSKNLAQIEAGYAKFAQYGADRTTPIFAIGGGVTGDIVGLAAATYMRGLPLVQIPTTLLAMVDSSIGGKNGIDLPQGKNLVGTFYNPRLIVADIRFLSTLPSLEWSNGLAEIFKAALISETGFLSGLEAGCHKYFGSKGWEENEGDSERFCAKGEGKLSADRANEVSTGADNGTLPVGLYQSLYRNHQFLVYLIRSAVEEKLYLVDRDPKDSGGDRFKLNLGHTFAHSLEVASSYSLPHGRAVGIGMILATSLALNLGILEEPLMPRMKRLLGFWGLPVSVPAGLDWKAAVDSLAFDKKRHLGRSVFVVPLAAGKVVKVEGIERALLERIFNGSFSTYSGEGHLSVR